MGANFGFPVFNFHPFMSVQFGFCSIYVPIPLMEYEWGESNVQYFISFHNVFFAKVIGNKNEDIKKLLEFTTFVKKNKHVKSKLHSPSFH